MTPEIKELVKRLRAPEMALNTDRLDAADALEALAGEVERLTSSERTARTLLEAEKWARINVEGALRSALEAERDRLKEALQPFSDAYERLVRTQESMGFGDNATFGLGIKVSAIKAARKALGGDAS